MTESRPGNADSVGNHGGWRDRHPWIPFVLPLAVFMLVGSLEPTADTPGGRAVGLAIPYGLYPLVYTLKIALTAAALAVLWPAYRAFPFRLSRLAVLVGLAGGGVWIALCSLHLEARLLAALGGGRFLDLGVRSAFNPLEQMAGSPAWAWSFLAIRFVGLALVIAVAEELFLRGFLMRAFVDVDWWKVPIGQVNTAAVVVGTLVPMFMHPQELLAAAVWFSLVTWMMLRTRNLWDCVLAHGLTNLVLGVWVVTSGQWELM